MDVLIPEKKIKGNGLGFGVAAMKMPWRWVGAGRKGLLKATVPETDSQPHLPDTDPSYL